MIKKGNFDMHKCYVYTVKTPCSILFDLISFLDNDVPLLNVFLYTDYYTDVRCKARNWREVVMRSLNARVTRYAV